MKSLHVLLLALSLAACGDYNRPGLGPGGMSADTLCYRHAYARKDPALAREVEARRLDCAEILESQESGDEGSNWNPRPGGGVL